jgi:hypothetical protein
VAAVEVTASRQPSVVEVLEAMRAAARARARAFATADLEPLAAADVPGSPAARADRQVVEGLIRAGLRLRGLAFAVDRVTIEGAPHDPDRSGGSGGGGSRDVVATATVTTSAHEQVADGGALVRRVGPRGPELVRVVLSPSGGRWRLRSVDPVGSSSRVSRR